MNKFYRRFKTLPINYDKYTNTEISLTACSGIAGRMTVFIEKNCSPQLVTTINIHFLLHCLDKKNMFIHSVLHEVGKAFFSADS